MDVQDLRDRRRDVATMLGELSDGNRQNAVDRGITELESAIAEVEQRPGSADEVAHARGTLAHAGLELAQFTVPRLIELSANALKVAGAAAVRVACAPIRLEDGPGTQRTFRDGRPMPPKPSRYTLPPEYRTAAAKVAAAVKDLVGR